MEPNDIEIRREFFKQLFDSKQADNFLNSRYFEWSQQILELEDKLGITQEQAAKVAELSLSKFLDFELGLSTNALEYKLIIRKLGGMK